MEDFVRKFEAVDSEEIGLPVAIATSLRHHFHDRAGVDFGSPTLCVLQDPYIAVKLARLIKQYQKAGDYPEALGLMVWLHSIRAMIEPDLRDQGRAIWRQLKRGFPHVPSCVVEYVAVTGRSLDIRGFDMVPDGLGDKT